MFKILAEFPLETPTIVMIVVLVVVFVIASKSVRIIRPFEKGLIERLGEYKRTANAGLTMIIPGVETLMKVDVREQVSDVPPQEVITKDNVVVTVDAVIYYEVTDPVKNQYNVTYFDIAATKLAQTNLRNLIGDLALDESLTSRDTINTRLRHILDEATDKWGVRVVRVELQRIEPPADVTQAMHRQMKAERERRATILEAEGEKQSQIERATGQRQSQILRAEGEGTAIRTVADARKYAAIAKAEGESAAIKNVFEAIHEGKPTNDLLALKYMEMMQGVANGRATKIFLPADTHGVMGSIAGIAELFKSAGDPPGDDEPTAKKKPGPSAPPDTRSPAPVKRTPPPPRRA